MDKWLDNCVIFNKAFRALVWGFEYFVGKKRQKSVRCQAGSCLWQSQAWKLSLYSGRVISIRSLCLQTARKISKAVYKPYTEHRKHRIKHRTAPRTCRIQSCKSAHWQLCAENFAHVFYASDWFNVWKQIVCLYFQKNVNYFLGEHSAVYRSQSGKVTIMDAYCPHMGANLAVGGRVRGECLECPFHGWVFDSDGKCIEIPYAEKSKIPIKMSIVLRDESTSIKSATTN